MDVLKDNHTKPGSINFLKATVHFMFKMKSCYMLPVQQAKGYTNGNLKHACQIGIKQPHLSATSFYE